MNAKMIIGFITILVFFGWNVKLGLANAEHAHAEYSHDESSEHYCCEGLMRHPVSHSHAADHLRHLLNHQKEIGLTEEQIKKLRALELDYDRIRIRAEAEIHIAERELHALMEEENTELSALEMKVKHSQMLETGLRMAALKARRDALAVLTREQREKAKEAHGKRIHEAMNGLHRATTGKGH